MADLQKGTTFVDGVSIANAANLNSLVDAGQILPGFIADKSDVASPSTGCEIAINDAGTLKKVTIANLAAVITGGLTGQVHGKTAVTTVSTDDEFLLWEDTAADERKITYGDLLSKIEGDVGLGAVTILTGTATINPAALGVDDGDPYNVTVTGASTTGTPAVFLGFSIAYPDHVVVANARVSAANTVTFNIRNVSEASGYDLGSHTVRAVVFQY